MKNIQNTSKKLIAFLFINCISLEIFTGCITLWNMWLAYVKDIPIDFTPLDTLLGAVISQVVAYAIYSVKAMRENMTGGISFETAMKNSGTSTNSQMGAEVPEGGN